MRDFDQFLLFFSEFLFEMHLLDNLLYLLNSFNKTLKIEKYTGKVGENQGNLSVQKCGNHV